MTYMIFAALLGAAFGSFLNVLIYRLPQGASLSFPASHCPKCQRALKIWHNIPIVSWLFLRGRCAYCKASIAFQYPLIELISLLLFVWVYLQFGWNVTALFTALSLLMLLALSLIDWRYKMVPDSINLSALLFAVLAHFSQETLLNALLFAGGFSLLRFVLSYYLYKKFSFLESQSHPAPWRRLYHVHFGFEAMGEADIIVAATMGALLGVKLGLFAIFLSALLTLPVALMRYKKDRQTPFIPFLFLATLLSLIFHTYILAYLDRLYV